MNSSWQRDVGWRSWWSSAPGELLDSLLRGGSWPGELSCKWVWWTRKSSGRWLLDRDCLSSLRVEVVPWHAGGHLWNLILRRSDDDDDGASCHTTSTRTTTLRAQVTAQSGLADAVPVINNLATAQVRTAEGILWQKKKFPTVVEEDGGILRWSDQGVRDDVGVCCWTEYGNYDRAHQSWILADCDEPGARSSLCCSRCIQHLWLSRVMRRMTLLPTRERTHCRHGGRCRSDMILSPEEGRETFFARFLLDVALSSGTPSRD